MLPPPQPLPLAGLGGEIDGGEPTRIGRGSNLFDQDAPAADPEATTPLPAVAPSKPRRRRAPGSVRWISVAVLAAILLALIGGGVALAVATSGATVAVPSLVGLSTKSATDQVAAVDLTLRITEQTADDPKDTVIAEHPAPGSFTSDNGSVALVVSRRPAAGAGAGGHRSVDRGREAALEQVGFGGEREARVRRTVPVDGVIGTDPGAAPRAA